MDTLIRSLLIAAAAAPYDLFAAAVPLDSEPSVATDAVDTAGNRPRAPRDQSKASADSHVQASYWYDWGWYGSYPRKSYESFGADSPLFNIVKADDRCEDGLLFIEPRGLYVETPGPVIVDGQGNLVWTDTKWGQAMDVKVQSYKGKDYITFWIGEDTGSFAGGTGSYLMLDDKYNLFKEVIPAGDLLGDLHEFSITEDGTALMTIYESIEGTFPGSDPDSESWTGWLYDCLFQEMDIETGELIFEWRATDHYHVLDSLQPPGWTGRNANSGFDFFHINSIDKNSEGDYLISARHMCAVACISHVDGSILWQLGGKGNSFADLSDGQATNIAWNHHASWHDNGTTVTLFDNQSNGQFNSASRSRGVKVSLNLDAMTATLTREYVAPLGYLAPSQGSVQVLPNGNVLVGWGHTPAYTEYTAEGEVLCDVHFGPIWFANFGWVKSYRDFKFPWVGRPDTNPDIAVRPDQQAVYVSWNGATEVREWHMQSSDSEDGSAATTDHERVVKTTFETRISVPDDAGAFITVVALDAAGNVLGRTRTVPRHEKTTKTLLEAPSRGWMPEPVTIFSWSLMAFLITIFALYHYRAPLRRVVRTVTKRVGKSSSSQHNYEPIPLQ
ncbi:Arylsulfotransferase (ASST) [Geosmithia morbida]|uniref:Arylsulfotransferase (ASST) n=1 Tax=Geosmithia morbida TaxID=1094350 RepID=A0A9P5D3R6_9HYPO|nr:Arylsulfotransferase (ASST) [Geosmithia morbida]KAF4122791.1 Arylsulfotransferase (ASST) [Geosmithia morbida]